MDSNYKPGPTPLADQPYPPQQPTDHDQAYRPPAMYPVMYSAGQYPAGALPVITQQPAAYQQTSNSTVVVNQQAVVVQGDTRNWSSGLCGCLEDFGSLCMGLLCPVCLLFDVSSKMGEGCCFPCCYGPNALLGLRIKLRVQQNIEGSLMNDYCVVQCCPLCVLCQLSRELKYVARELKYR